jgi:hypothetical protein
MSFNSMKKCSWPGCSVKSERPFSEGWSCYGNPDFYFPGLPDEGWLCQRHNAAFEALATKETTAE